MAQFLSKQSSIEQRRVLNIWRPVWNDTGRYLMSFSREVKVSSRSSNKLSRFSLGRRPSMTMIRSLRCCRNFVRSTVLPTSQSFSGQSSHSTRKARFRIMSKSTLSSRWSSRLSIVKVQWNGWQSRCSSKRSLQLPIWRKSNSNCRWWKKVREKMRIKEQRWRWR